ncbi:histidine kinase dimerization/phospho-acceptor domain-containing protein [Shewanella sedimentimangrovi]|uniref:histidine kinase n=1 Tax=Shewanella sedimentimangrovi TaxID=2814293 RepID=A0ABX7R370_9GAMM|nr:histidine kinase dimerization/phospho-acceptor domain-containing protein [Shewanella sedimentimangrovi]QSX37528.1 hypothetical protein JYB85_01380 [Shewanella sedimentimangrovi]
MKQPLTQRPKNIDSFAAVDRPLTDAECQARKAEFLAMLSHELRTPLSVIKLYVEAIQDGMYDNQDLAFARLDAKFEEFEHLMEELLQRGKE